MTEAIIEKLQKLLNQQRGAAAIGSEAEAAAFGQKLQELLDKHNLSEADLAQQAKTGRDASLDMGLVRMNAKDDESWKTFLLCELAKLNTCKVFVGERLDLYVGGTATDIVITRELFNYFGQLISDLAQNAGYDYLRRLGYIEFDEAAFTQFYRSYALGAAQVLTARLAETKQADFAQAQSSSALLVIDKKEQALKVLTAEFSAGDEDRENDPLNHAAYVSGAKAAHDIALTTKTMQENQDKKG